MVNKFVIDLEECEKNNISLNHVLYLISVYFGNPFHCKESLDELVEKRYVVYYGYNEGFPDKVILTDTGIQLIETLFLNSEFKEGTKVGDRFKELAKQLQELYPEGKKQGTQYYWRDSTNVIIKKLKAIVKKYGDCFTNEQAIEATRKYVASFNGDYKYMQLLKYFICKNVIKGGEVEETSQLLSYIENNGQSDTQQMTIDWETELR